VQSHREFTLLPEWRMVAIAANEQSPTGDPLQHFPGKFSETQKHPRANFVKEH